MTRTPNRPAVRGPAVVITAAVVAVVALWLTAVLAAPAASAATERPQPNQVAADPRPPNGTDIVRRGGSGPGVLAVENGTGRDAVVTLARGNRAAYSVYVTAGRSTTITDVADGTYQVVTRSGLGWNRAVKDFGLFARSERFDRAATFTSRRTDDGLAYSRVSVTLQAVPFGNARTTPLDPAAVPR